MAFRGKPSSTSQAGLAVIAAAAAATMVLGAAFAGGASASITAPAGAHSAGGKQIGIADPDLITKPAKVQASELAAMKAAGITSIRLDADWSVVQHAGAKSFSWGQLDQVVKSVRAAGMTADLIIDGTPAWAAKAGTSRDASPPPASSAVTKPTPRAAPAPATPREPADARPTAATAPPPGPRARWPPTR